jgi:autotransporter-associated beta strand protein
VIDTQGFPVTINQALVHSTIAGDAATDGGLTKKGSGTLTLSGVNSYNGATSVKAGTLIVNGSLLGSSPVTVGDSSNPSTRAILAGEGTVGAVTVGSGANDTGATLNPGNGAGTITGTTLTTGGLTLNSGAHISLQLGRTAAGSSTGGNVSDQIVVNGGISLAGDLQISLLASTGYSIAPGDILYLIINQSGSPVTGTFGSLNGVVTNLSNDQVFSFNGESFEITYHAQSGLGAFTGGNDVALMVVPEPSIFATLLVSGGLLICLKGLGRRRARA